MGAYNNFFPVSYCKCNDCNTMHIHNIEVFLNTVFLENKVPQKKKKKNSYN